MRISTRTPAVAGSAPMRRVASRPSISGMRMSISTTSGTVARTTLDGLGAVAGLAHDLEVVGRVDDDREPAADQGLVVGDDDPGDAVTAHVGVTVRQVGEHPVPAAGPRAGAGGCRPTAPPARACRRGRGRPRRRRRVRRWRPRPRPSSTTSTSTSPGAAAHGDRGAGRPGVLDDVGEPLLHEPVDRQLDGVGHLGGLALDGELDGHAGAAHVGDEPGQLGQPGRGGVGRVAVLVAEHAEQPAHLLEGRCARSARWPRAPPWPRSGRWSMTCAPMPACTAITDIEWATTSWSSWARRRRSSATERARLLALGLGPLLGLGEPGGGGGGPGPDHLAGQPRRR